MQRNLAMTMNDFIKIQPIVGDLVIIKAEDDDWYEALEMKDELEQQGVSVILFGHYSGNILKVSEKAMNKIGWYRNG